MALPDVLARGRAMAEARMGAQNDGSTCTIRRRSGRRAQDERTGKESPEWVVVHAELPMRVDFGTSGEGASRVITVAGIEYPEATAVHHFPVFTEDLEDGDYIDITAGESTGTVWSIVKAVRADQKTARRLPVKGESRPTEWGA